MDVHVTLCFCRLHPIPFFASETSLKLPPEKLSYSAKRSSRCPYQRLQLCSRELRFAQALCVVLFEVINQAIG